jgi:hypothetical protein
MLRPAFELRRWTFVALEGSDAPAYRRWTSLLEMPFRKGAPRSGFQIALEAGGSLLIRKFNDDMKLPWSVPRSVPAATGIVVVNSPADIGRQADVVAGIAVRISQGVDESLVTRHKAHPQQAECLRAVSLNGLKSV